MMKSFIYMNANVGSKEPGITVLTAGKRIHANRVQIDGPSVICTGLLEAVAYPEVKAWIECEFDDLTIME